MPNVLQYSVGSTPSTCLRKGNFLIGNNTADYGGLFYNGITPPTNGYTIYSNKGANGPSIYIANNDTELISLTNRELGGSNLTSVAQCLTYFATQTDKMVFNIDYPPIATSGLVLNIDAGFTPSYPQSGVTWYDISGSGNTGTLINGPTYSSANGGSIVFDGVDDYITLGTQTIIQNDYTLNIWYKLNNSTVKENFIFSANYNATPALLITGDDFGNGTSRLTAYYNSGGTVFNYILNTSLLNPSLIYNITLVRSGGVNTPYINGIAQTSQVFTQSVTISSGLYELGYATLRGKTTAYMQGNIYDTQIYNRALSSTEVLQNYQAMFPRFLGENIVTSGLVFYVDAGYMPSYPTSGLTWYDVSGYGNNGTLTNGPTYSSANGGSIVFDGVDDNIALPINSVFNTPSVTYEVWANLQTINDRHILYVNWVGNSLEVNSNRSVVMYNYTGNQLGAQTSVGVFNWDSWTHFLGTYDDSSKTLKIYVNGVLLGTRINTPSTVYSVGYHRISGVQYGGEVKGNISIVRQYNRELTQAEITQNYNAQKGRYGL
jgi:hypothetical protein